MLLKKIVLSCQDRLHTLNEIVDYGAVYFQEPDLLSDSLLETRQKMWGIKESPEYLASLNYCNQILSQLELIQESDFTADFIKVVFKKLAADLHAPTKNLLAPFRFILSGSAVGNPLEETLQMMGKDRSLKRIKCGLEAMRK